MTSYLQTNIDDLIKPQQIQDYIKLLEYPGYQLQEYFPDKLIQGNLYSWDATQLAQEPAVPYRAWDTETPLGARQGVSKKHTELPPLGKKKLMTEEQALKLRALETGDYSAYIQQIYDDIGNLVQGVQGRWEIDRGTLLSTGALTITTGDGPSQAISYSVPGGNIVTAGTLWSDVANADIIANLNTWITAYKAANRGLAPGRILVSETVRGLMLRNSALRASMYYGAPNTGPSVVKEEDVQAELRAHGFPPFTVIDSQATNASGTTAAVFPANKIVMLPPAGIEIGYTAKGVTPSALGMVEAGTLKLAEAPGIVGLSWTENDPAQRFNMVDACGMPVLANPSMLFIATVTA